MAFAQSQQIFDIPYVANIEKNARAAWNMDSSILKTVPVSQDSKEYAWCKRGEFVHNNTKTFI